MTRPYLQHGRRHAPGGTDPIPGLAGGFASSWVFGYDTGVSVPSQTTPYTHYDFTTSNNYTNDAATFDIAASTGLQINSTGFYVAFVSCIFTAAGSTVSEAAEVVWNLAGLGDNINDQSAYLPSFGLNTAYLRAFQGFVVDSTSVGTAAPLNLRQTGGATAAVDVQFAVAKLTDDVGNF